MWVHLLGDPCWPMSTLLTSLLAFTRLTVEERSLLRRLEGRQRACSLKSWDAEVWNDQPFTILPRPRIFSTQNLLALQADDTHFFLRSEWLAYHPGLNLIAAWWPFGKLGACSAHQVMRQPFQNQERSSCLCEDMAGSTAGCSRSWQPLEPSRKAHGAKLLGNYLRFSYSNT